MIYGFYTKISEKIDEIKAYVKEKYAEDIVEYTNINWGSGSDQSGFYTFFDIATANFDIQTAKRDLSIAIIKLENGNNFYNVTTYIANINDYIPLLERLLEDKAKEYFFDNSIDACSYTTSDNLQFRKESLAFVKWRDELWGPIFEQLKLDISNGNPPDLDVFLTNLPTYESILETIIL